MQFERYLLEVLNVNNDVNCSSLGEFLYEIGTEEAILVIVETIDELNQRLNILEG